MEFKINSPKHGEFTVLIDDEDYDKIKDFKWYVGVNKKYRYYVGCGFNFGEKGKRKQKTIQLHRFIIDCPEGMVVDHVNHNTLDNRKSNLRICSQSENCKNNQKSKINKSGFKGVKISIKKHKGKIYSYWVAAIGYNYKNINLGSFKNKKDAAMAYNQAAIKYHGEFASLNIIEE